MNERNMWEPEGTWEGRLIFLTHVVEVGDEKNKREEEDEAILLPDKIDISRSREFPFDCLKCDPDNTEW